MAKRSKVRGVLNKDRMHAFFGPPPVLKEQDPAEYYQLLSALYAELKPEDLAVEAGVHDIAHANWGLRTWRRIRTCVVDGAMVTAIAWILSMPADVRLRFLRGHDEIDLTRQPNRKLSEETSDKQKQSNFAQLHDDPFIADSILARANLEEFEILAKIEGMITYYQSQRNKAYREIHLHRRAMAEIQRNDNRLLEEAEHEVIQFRHRPGRKPKSAA